jgi:CO/xanthine dehydrogenase FAD-binding subunit
VKPAAFDYRAPRSLDEALAILAEAGGDGRVLAGGQSLMPMMNMRVVAPSVLVDINRLEGLPEIEADADELRFGPLVRHADLGRDARIAEGWPLMAEAIRQVAHPAIRNRGTVCGSVAHNDPAAEAPTVLAALDGRVMIASASGRRELAPDDFSLGMMTTALEPGEMVVGLRYPRPAPGTGVAFVEFARRLGDFAMAGAAVLLTMEGEVCTRARITVLGMGDGPFRASEAEAVLTGATLNGHAGEALDDAAASLRAEVQPEGDVLVSAGYRRHLAGVMARRAMGTALERARALNGGAA